MADVIQIAKNRRKALATELAKLDDFIQMAESLMKWHESKGEKASDAGAAKTAGPGEPMALRTESIAGAA